MSVPIRSPLDSNAARVFIRHMYAEAVASVDPRHAVVEGAQFDGRLLRTTGGSRDLSKGRVVVLAVGKAAVPMAQGMFDVLGDRIDVGIVLTKSGQQLNQVPGFEILEASHPVPDARGVRATQVILDLVSNLTAKDHVIALISGGGSALLEAPKSPITLADIQVVTSELLKAGAPIQDLNAVRSELSLVKGGGLRRAIGSAVCVSLIMSDVLGNDPSVIASGPTVPRNPNPGKALELIKAYRLEETVPTSVLEMLRTALSIESVKPNVRHDAHDVWRILGDNDRLIDTMADVARSVGSNPSVVWRNKEGEARDLGFSFVEVCDAMPDDVDVVLGGGEATVTVHGNGIGGRNTEFALAAAIALSERKLPWMIASLASDGDDGNNFASAGGIVDRDTLCAAAAVGIDADSALATNDSGTFLSRIGSLFECKPTGTNVNDGYIGIRVKS